MLEAILAGSVVIVLIVLRVAMSHHAHRAVDRAIKGHTEANLSNNLDLYEQMKAARARGEEIRPPSTFN